MPLTLAELEALDRRMPNGPWRLTDALQVEASDGRLVASEVDVINCKVDDLSALRSVLPAYIERLRSDKRWMEFVARMQMNCQKSLDECAEEMQEAAERHGVTLPGPKSSRVDVSVNLSNGENATDVEAAIGKNFSAYRYRPPPPLGEKVGVVDFNKAPEDKPYNIADLKARQANLIADLRDARLALMAKIDAMEEDLSGMDLLTVSLEKHGNEIQRSARWHEATESQRHDAQLEWQIIKRVLEAAPRKPAEATPERLTNLYSAMRALEGHRGEAAARRAAERSADCD